MNTLLYAKVAAINYTCNVALDVMYCLYGCIQSGNIKRRVNRKPLEVREVLI